MLAKITVIHCFKARDAISIMFSIFRISPVISRLASFANSFKDSFIVIHFELVRLFVHWKLTEFDLRLTSHNFILRRREHVDV